MDKFSIFAQDQRLLILRSLLEGNYDANESILRDCLALYGHDISKDALRNHLLWLEEMGLIKLRRLLDGYLVASLAQRGEDVAKGRSVVAGVRRPSPEF